MERKYYIGEQILEALSEVGVGAGDTSEVLSYLGRLPSAEPEPEKYEYHYDHTDCIWYRPEARNRCPVTCAQYRDGLFELRSKDGGRKMICKIIGNVCYMIEAAYILYIIEWWKAGGEKK